MNIFKFVYLGLFFLAIMLFLGLSNSPNKTSSVDWYFPKIFYALVIFLIAWVVHGFTGISLLPFGDNDPDTYLLQKLGYLPALGIAVISMVLLSWFFGANIKETGKMWLPVPSLLSGSSLQTVSKTSYEFWSGTKTSKALADSVGPTLVENTLVIYLGIIFLWLVPRYILQSFGVPSYLATFIGFSIWVLAIGGIFSFVYHPFAYQGVEPAYWRAYFFTIACGVPTGLTGFPVCDPVHFINNYVSSSEGLTSRPNVVLIQAPSE